MSRSTPPDRKRPQITFLNRCYWPDVEATGQLLEQLCETLVPEWDVTVVVGQPNRNPSGTQFVRRGREVRNGVTIDRLRHTTFPKSSRVGRLSNLLSFTWQVRQWGRRQRSEPPMDVIVSETDPFFLPIVAASIARRADCKFVVYVQDIYPDIAIGLGVVKEGIVTRQIRRRLLSAYRQADRIVVLDEDMRDRLVGWGLPHDKFAIVPNWVETKSIRPIKTDNAFRETNGLKNRFVVMHSGNMGMSQRLETLIDATCERNWPEQAVVALVGDGARRAMLERYAAERPESRVRFFDYQPRERLSESLSAADLHVISMDANIRGCLAPSKLYGILASGTPVVAIAPPDFAIVREIEDHKIGGSVTPDNPVELAAFVRSCIDNPDGLAKMQHSARMLAQRKYDREICCRKFHTVLHDTIENDR